MSSAAEHHELIEALQQCRAAVALSGYPSPLYDEALTGLATGRVRCIHGPGQHCRTAHRGVVGQPRCPAAATLFEVTARACASSPAWCPPTAPHPRYRGVAVAQPPRTVVPPGQVALEEVAGRVDAVETAAAALVRRTRPVVAGTRRVRARPARPRADCCRSLSRRPCHPDWQRDPRPAGRPRRVRARRPLTRPGAGRTRLSPESVVGAPRGPCGGGPSPSTPPSRRTRCTRPAWRSHRALTWLACVASDIEDLLTAGDSAESA